MRINIPPVPTTIVVLAIIAIISVPYGLYIGNKVTTGPVIVPRSPSDPSIHESIVSQSAGYKQDVFPQIAILPASYEWFSGLLKAIGSPVQQFMGDTNWLGMKTNQSPPPKSGGYQGVKENQGRLYAGYKNIGGKNITDTPMLGQVCGSNPGDPYWVAYWRPGNVEIPPPYQVWHNQFDCYCRCNEMIACPIPTYAGTMNWHRIGGGPATHYISCQMCFGMSAHIRKHDIYVGTSHGSFPGYPPNMPEDLGYQECLRQSTESYAASGPGGGPSDPTLFGM